MMDSKLSYEEYVKIYNEYQQKYIEYNKTYEELKEEINKNNKEREELKEKIEKYSYPVSVNRYTFIQKHITKRSEYKAKIEKSKEDDYNKSILRYEIEKKEKENNINNIKLEEVKSKLEEIKLQIDKIKLEMEEREKNINEYINELIVEREEVGAVLRNIEYKSKLCKADKDYAKKCIKEIIKEKYREKLYESKKQCTSEICLPENMTIGVEIECLNKLRPISYTIARKWH